MRRIVRTGLSFIVIFLMLAIVSGVALAAEKVIAMKLGVHWPRPHVMTAIMESWMKDIETRTEGKVKIAYYPADQLVSLKNGLEKIGSGVVEMGDMNPEYYPAQLPLSGVHGLPFAYATARQGTKVLMELRDLFDQEFEKNKLKLLWGLTPPPYLPLTGDKPILKLDDWKGVRFRSGGSTQAAALQALGAVPAVVHTGEMYTALQRGTIDGALFPLSAGGAFKLEEVTKFVTLAPLSTAPIVLVMNLKTWKALPKDIQDKIMQASATAAEKTGIHYDEEEAKATVAWAKRGIKIYTPPDSEMALWKKTAAHVWDNWIAENEAKGLPAKKIADEVRKRAEQYK